MAKKIKKQAKTTKPKKPVRVSKRAAPTKVKHEIMVSVQATQSNLPTVQELAQPLKDGKALSLPKTWVSDKQILRMVQRTPKEHIYERKGKGGQIWTYVTGTYVEKVLNFVFGFLWDFEVQSHGREGDFIWVLGKLTVKNPSGSAITKTQFGRAEIKYKKDTAHKPENMLDYGNDLKAATTDALKKCASLLGIASDIYGKAEFKDEAGKDVPEERPKQAERVIQYGQSTPKEAVVLKRGQVMGPDGYPTYISSESAAPISEAEYEYSMKFYGRALSKDEQKSFKPNRK